MGGSTLSDAGLGLHGNVRPTGVSVPSPEHVREPEVLIAKPCALAWELWVANRLRGVGRAGAARWC